MKNYTENHQKSRNLNIFLLTPAIFRGLRSVFFKTFFFHCIRNISESLYLKNYCVISFFSKIIQFFLGVDCGVHSPPQDMIIFYPPRIGLICQSSDHLLGVGALFTLLCGIIWLWWQWEKGCRPYLLIIQNNCLIASPHVM